MKNKSLFALVLCIILCSLETMTVFAAINPTNNFVADAGDDEFEVTDEAEGEGNEVSTEYIYIEIGTADELIDLAKECRLDTWSKNKYVKLTEDIHLAGAQFDTIACFAGVFDGNGHTIDGFIFNDNKNYAGFFSKVFPKAEIKNLTLAGNIAPSNKQMIVGGVAGENYGTIRNCKFEGVVRGNDYVGGIAGYNEATGIITDCSTYGVVSGQHYSGGIAGTNAGGIYRCKNSATVNTTNEDKGSSIGDMSISDYVSGLLSLGSDSSESKTLDKANSVIDSGGIAGYSSGVVEYCENEGDVGYEHVGYNVGGIVGRQSGYLHSCKNNGTILGRKDVGGITGQAEPYLALDLTEDIIYQLNESINELHDLVDNTLQDSGSSSDTISNRLSLVKQFVDGALNDTSYLSSETINYLNGLTGSANEVLSRIDYSMDEAGKDGGALDKSKSAMSDVKKAAENLDKAANDANIENYMTEAEKVQYERDVDELKKVTEEYSNNYKNVYDNNYYYYLYVGSKTSDASKSYYGMDADPDMTLIPRDADDVKMSQDVFPSAINVTSDCVIKSIVHQDDSSFPSSDATQRENDNDLIVDASNDAVNTSDTYAKLQTQSTMGILDYDDYVNERTTRIIKVVTKYSSQMAGESKEDLIAAADNLKSASGNLESSASQTRQIVKDVNGMDDIVLPSLGDGYKAHTSSFVANLQGMSDNMGFLNDEMNNASDTLVEDMQGVNDSFNKVMLLFTDAMDGALDGDYSDVLEDESYDVCEDSIEGTVANCYNNGTVRADINASGICGTMAIEFDFDLEGSVTGNKDSKLNSTYRSRCVARKNINDGRITSHKSYAGGITGLQELGTILLCENYGRIASSSGDYVGGIAGESVTSIRDSYSRGIYSGGKYIGGIAGYGHSIIDCYSLPVIKDAVNYYGAIAGEVDDNYRLENNYFCSEELTGIDRISYGKMAEPLDYETFIKLDGLPDDFKKMSVTFLVEDDVVSRLELPYGGSLKENEYPEALSEDDCYIEWDTSLVHDITGDIEIVGEETRYLTTIAGRQLRSNNQSAILVDGRFKKGQQLDTVLMSGFPENNGKVLECWKITIPDDGNSTHQIRVQLPADVRKTEIKLSSNNSDYTTVNTSEMGMYQLFDVEGDEAYILIIDKSLSIKTIIVILVVTFIILVAVIIIVSNNYRKKHPKIKSNKNKKEKKQKLSRAEKRAIIEEKVKEAVVEYIEDDGTARGPVGAEDDSIKGTEKPTEDE